MLDWMRLPAAILLFGFAASARAVVVQGTVTGPLGRPVPGARVQLIALNGPAHSIADTVSGVDGGYEIRTEFAGRFLLLTSSVYYVPQLSTDFYGGRTDVLLQNIVLDPREIAPQTSDLGSGLRESLALLSDPPEQTAGIQLLPRALVAEALSSEAGGFLLERGQTGQSRTLYLRGGSPETLGVQVDGEEVNPLGGPEGRAYDFGVVSTTGFAAPEPTPALEVGAGPYPEDALTAGAGVVDLRTPHATNSRVALDYAGDAGNLHSWRDEVELTATRKRADVLLAGSRFDTSNALLNDRFHVGTLAGSAGYQVSGNTGLRIMARQNASAGALPMPYDLGLQPLTRDARQETVGSAVFSTRTSRDWQNELQYGMLRSREQVFVYSNPVGRLVSLTGANGYSVSGQATPYPLPGRQDWATERDDVRYRTGYPVNRHLSGELEVHFGDERALDATAAGRLAIERRNLGGVATLHAEFKHRVFMQAAGEVTHSSSFGLLGSPRIGATWAPVLPTKDRRFRGTVVHATIATGFTEPSLPAESQGVTTAGRTRTLNLAVDQNVFREKVVVRGGYFHSQYSHQVEPLAQTSAFVGEPLLGEGLAYRIQGATLDVRYQFRARWLIRGTYTYLASLVELSGVTANTNPLFPGVRIGALTALTGSRPFNRPSQAGSVITAYAGRLLSAGIQASIAGRSDGTTGMAQSPLLLLPNQNVNHGFTKLDANLAFIVTRRTSVFAQAANLLNDQHIGAIGYPSAPLTVRAGVRFRLGGE